MPVRPANAAGVNADEKITRPRRRFFNLTHGKLADIVKKQGLHQFLRFWRIAPFNFRS